MALVKFSSGKNNALWSTILQKKGDFMSIETVNNSCDLNINDPRLDQYIFVERDQVAFEKTLNVLGYIPVISSASGCVRIISSIIQLVSSAVKMPLCAIADLFQATPKGYAFRIKKHAGFMGHSLSNIFRGCVEFPWFIGNIACFCYDRFIGRIRYETEKRI